MLLYSRANVKRRPLHLCCSLNNIIKMFRNLLKRSTFFNLRRFSTSALPEDSPKIFIPQNDFYFDYVETNQFQKTILSVGSAIVCLFDPTRHDMIASLGETTSDDALIYMREQMFNTEEGTRILRDKPRINSKTIDFEKLKLMPENTLGKVYSNFLHVNGVTADSRLTVQFIKDPELAYIMQRYREVHDLVHSVLQMKTNMLGEVTIKWIEALQNKMPMCIGGAIFGAGRLKTKHRQLYLSHYLPWAVKTGINANFLLGVHFEERWDQPLDEFHKEMNVEPFSMPKKSS